MYVDWVKVYQETGSKDFGQANLAQFGIFGVYEDEEYTDVSMDLGFDLKEHTSGVTIKTDETAYEGDNVLSYNTSAGQAYELKLSAGLNRNMSRYNEGSVQLYIKTDINDDIQIGIADTLGNEAFVTFNPTNEDNFLRNGSWLMTFVSIADLGTTIDISALKDMLIIKGNSSTAGFISLDKVIYKETVPAKGYYAINCDNPNITEGFVVDKVTNNLYIWSNTIAFGGFYPAYEGENVLSYKATGAEPWCGFGYNSNTPLNFENYADGYLNISVRAKTTVAFYFGMDGDGHGGVVDFVSGSDPYGFERNGEWYHLNIPMSDLVSNGLNLASVNHVFKTGSGGKIGDIAIDNIFLSAELPDIENPMVCYANKISISPANKIIDTDEDLILTAGVLNQFGNKFDSNVSWSTDGGAITETGTFNSPSVGTFTITATQDNTTGTTTVIVEEPSVVGDRTEDQIHSYLVASENKIVVNGLKKQSQISVVNVAGIVIYNETVNMNSINISLANQTSGIFIIKVASENKVHVNKFVKR